MKIQKISVYQVSLPIPGGGVSVSGAKTPEMVESTIVAVETDGGIVG
jgi:L-alanine-DL-glutamate epimerase-like enolase superfamily enzyme